MTTPQIGTQDSSWDDLAFVEFTGNLLSISITVESGNGTLSRGTVMAIRDDNGKAAPYDDGDAQNVDIDVADGILIDEVDTSGGDVQASMFIRGTFNTGDLTGLDSNAVSDMGGNQIEGRNLLVV